MIGKIWNLLNGRKTAIGAALMYPQALHDQILQGIWHLGTGVTQNIVHTCTVLGVIVTTGGLGHKGVKTGATLVKTIKTKVNGGASGTGNTVAKAVLFIGLGLSLLGMPGTVQAGQRPHHLNWGVGIEAGVTGDTNLEGRIDWHVGKFSGDAWGRGTDYGAPMPVNGTARLRGCFPWRIQQGPASLVYASGTQWALGLRYAVTPRTGPVARYERFSDVDATYFVGWRVEVGR